MNRRWPCVLLLVALTAAASPNRPDDAVSLARERTIRASGEYRWGEGFSNDEEEARKAALQDLAQKIQVQIRTEAKAEAGECDGKVFGSYVESTVAVSNLSLRGLDVLTFRERVGVRAFAYIHRDSLAASFARTKLRIREMATAAHEAAQDGRVADALRQCYWAYLLTHTIVDTLHLSALGTAATWPAEALRGMIRGIVDSLTVRADTCTREADIVYARLHFDYRGRPVKNLDFSYYSGVGTDYGSVHELGQEIVPLYAEPGKLILNLMYEYPLEMKAYPDLCDLQETFKSERFNNTTFVNLSYPWKRHGHSPAAVPTTGADSSGSGTAASRLGTGSGNAEMPDSTAQKATLPPKIGPPMGELELDSTPPPIRVLVDVRGTREFLSSLGIYFQDGRLWRVAAPDFTDGGTEPTYAAVFDADSVRGIFRLERSGVIDLRSGQHVPSLSSAFRGLRVVYFRSAIKP